MTTIDRSYGHTDGSRDYSPRSRIERIIALGRLVIIGCVLAFCFDPSASGVIARPVSALLAVYFIYVVAVGSRVWRERAPTHRWRVADQVLDGTLGLLLLHFTGGTSSLFFPYLSFPVLFATLRWQWRGALGAGTPAVLAFLILGAVEIAEGAAQFEARTFGMRAVYLSALTGLLCYTGAYEQRMRRAMTAVAMWNPPSGVEAGDMSRMLATAGAVVGARRAVLAWTDRDEATLHIAFWTGAEVRCWDEPGGKADELVARDLRDVDFVSRNVGTSRSPIMWIADGRLNRSYRIDAVPAALQRRFSMQSVIAVRIQGELVRGRLFLLDMPDMTSDDLVTASVLARQVHYYLAYRVAARQLATAAAAEERIRLARDVHDGALQSFAGIRLQLEAARRLIIARPAEAQGTLLELQELVTAEQRGLRRLVSRLQRAETNLPELDDDLTDMITVLVLRIERQWNVRVKILTSIVNEEFEAAVPSVVIGELYQILREAMVNAARHARAKTVTLSMSLENGAVRLTVADDGHGFPFTGRYDLRRLIRFDMGPTVLRERVAALGGTLTIDSSRDGARLEIGIPLFPSVGLSARASSIER